MQFSSRRSCLITKFLINLVSATDALLNFLPEPIHIYATRYPHAPLTNRHLLGNRSPSLHPALLGLLKRALGQDRDVEALVVFGLLALSLVPVVKGDLVDGAGEDGCDSDGVVQGRASGNAECVAAFLSVTGSP